jgi:DivIVA domain-containing protein
MAQELARVEFATAMRGYDKDEVDTFLQELAEEHNRLLADLAAARRTAEKAHLELGEEMGDLLQHAKDVAAANIKKGEERAAEIKEKARRAAERTIAEAQRKGDELRRAAEADAVVRIRTAQEQVQALQEVEKDVRAQLQLLRSTLASLDRQVDEASQTPAIDQPILDDAGEVVALQPTPTPAASPAPA